MDTAILLNSLLAFLAFLIFQIIGFRYIHQDAALRWLGKLYCMIGATLCLVLIPQPEIALMSMVLFTGFSGVYMLCIFAVIEGSLTLRILSEIAASGNRGISKSTLIRQYNTREIVRKRISRFLIGGDIEIVKDLYRWKNPYSLYIIRERVLDGMKFFFPKMEISSGSNKSKKA